MMIIGRVRSRPDHRPSRVEYKKSTPHAQLNPSDVVEKKSGLGSAQFRAYSITVCVISGSHDEAKSGGYIMTFSGEDRVLAQHICMIYKGGWTRTNN